MRPDPRALSAVSEVECSRVTPGVDCGATVEQWPDEDAARKRADYIQTVHESAPTLGQEWTTVRGNLLLRVTGLLKPSSANSYESAFTA
jgi:serine/threonine-protein kinase